MALMCSTMPFSHWCRDEGSF